MLVGKRKGFQLIVFDCLARERERDRQSDRERERDGQRERQTD